MKGIILAGGSGSRLYPMTKVMTKQLQPIYDKPMIYYPLSTLMLSGIRDILLITTAEDRPHFEKLLGSGDSLGIKITYQIQCLPNGISEAFILGRDFIGNDDVALILGDNLFYGDFDVFRKAVKGHQERSLIGPAATIFGYFVVNPQEFGVVEFEKESHRVISLEEKPTNPKSPYAIPGFYLFDSSIAKRVENQKPSLRGELEITDSIKSYLIEKDLLKVEILGRGIAWLDTGTPKSLLEASSFIAALDQRQGFKVACLEEIALRMDFISIEKFNKILNKYPKGSYKQYLELISADLNQSSTGRERNNYQTNV